VDHFSVKLSRQSAHEEQSESHAFTRGLGGEEWLASVFCGGLAHTRAAVRHSELESALVETDFEFDRAVWGRSFASVLDENDESLSHWLDRET
jgi:hypothetical protein